jgi:hypothetical protein
MVPRKHVVASNEFQNPKHQPHDLQASICFKFCLNLVVLHMFRLRGPGLKSASVKQKRQGAGLNFCPLHRRDRPWGCKSLKRVADNVTRPVA